MHRAGEGPVSGKPEVRVDVAVVGGGPAGCATALALSRRGFSVTIAERSDVDRPRIGETLPSAVCRPLVALGLWDEFLAGGHARAFATRSAWGSTALHENNAIFNPYGAGWHLDRARFDAMLAAAAERAGAKVLRGAHVEGAVERRRGRWRLEVRHETRRFVLQTGFLVDATGRGSLLVRRLGARRISHDLLIGVVRFFQTAVSGASEDTATLVEAAPLGWWYSAPLPGGVLVAALMTDPDLYARLRRTVTDPWADQLQQAPHTLTRLRSLDPIGVATVVAAGGSLLSTAVGDGWAAVGDAAAAYDPLAGQGIYKALEAGLRAAAGVAAAHDADGGSVREYADWVNGTFVRYLLTHREIYGRERRFPDSTFWKRRQRQRRVWPAVKLAGGGLG